MYPFILFGTQLSLSLSQVKDKESDLKAAEQKLHDEFERLRRQNAEEKRELDSQKTQLVHNTFIHATV